MAQTELIPLSKGIEQTVTLPYGETSYDITFRYDDYNSTWFFDVVDSNGNNYLTGIRLALNVNPLSKFDYLGLGKIVLVDTTPLDETAINMFSDFGDRLKVYRYI